MQDHILLALISLKESELKINENNYFLYTYFLYKYAKNASPQENKIFSQHARNVKNFPFS